MQTPKMGAAHNSAHILLPQALRRAQLAKAWETPAHNSVHNSHVGNVRRAQFRAYLFTAGFAPRIIPPSTRNARAQSYALLGQCVGPFLHVLGFR
jgi:hypothetical protein